MGRNLLLLCAVLWGMAHAGERVALVVGCGTYANMPGRQLLSPVSDGEDMALALRTMGYRLVGGGPLKNASRDRLLEAVEDLIRQARTAEAAVFYFSGHGVQIGEDNYLLPVDSPKITGISQIKSRAVNLRESVMVGLEESGVETKVVVLDCCRDNPFAAQLEAAMATVGKSVRTKSVGEMTGYGPGFYLAFATSPGREALDGNGNRNSPFTGAVVRTLETSGGKDIDLFFRDVKQRMPSDQVSWTSSSLKKEFALATGMRGPSTGPSGAVEALTVERRARELAEKMVIEREASSAKSVPTSGKPKVVKYEPENKSAAPTAAIPPAPATLPYPVARPSGIPGVVFSPYTNQRLRPFGKSGQPCRDPSNGKIFIIP